MWLSCRAVFLFKNAGRFRIFCKQPKLLVLNFFPLEGNCFSPVTYFHGKAYHSYNIPDLIKQHTKQSSKRQYVKELYDETDISNVLKKINTNADQRLIPSIINKIHFIVQKKCVSKKLSKEIRSQPEFKTFINQIKVTDLKYSDLTVLIEVLEKIHLPYTHFLYKQMLLRITEINEKLDFYELVEVHHFLTQRYKFKYDASEKLIELLEKEIQGMLKDKYFLLNPRNKTAALQFSLYNPVSDEIQSSIWSAMSTLNPEEVLEKFNYFCKYFFSETSSIHPAYKTVKKYFFQIVNENCVENLPLSYVTNFALNYALQMKNLNVAYDPELVDFLMSVAVKCNAKNNELYQILKSASVVAHINYELLSYAINVAKTDSHFVNEYVYGYTALINLIASSNRNYQHMERWSEIVPSLPNLNHLPDCFDKRKKAYLEPYLFVVIDLASLGIFQDDTLNFLSENVSRQDIKARGIGFSLLLLILNQAAKILYPSYKDRVLKDDVFKAILHKLQPYNKTMLEQKRNLLNDVQNCFDSVLGSKSSVLMGVNTKLGNFIDGVLAISNEGKAYSFASMDESSYIEDIKIPVNYRMHAIFLFGSREYNKHSLSIASSRTLLLKTLEAMGIKTMYVLDDVWNSLDRNEKESFLRNEIFNNRQEDKSLRLQKVSKTKS